MVSYDCLIIGAGIGGLVCGCYLAKSGIKVLITEQSHHAGGYCTSFKRDGYTFDVGVHYLGSLREEGILYRILKDLELLDRIKFIINDPTDRIITPDETIFIRKDKEKTKEELLAHFPAEKENINNFFKFILTSDFLSLTAKTKKLTFTELLDSFFTDYKLKAILSTLLGNVGLPPSQASALVSAIIYKEFILDGGYYPKGGIQFLPDLLSERFREYGGELLLSTKVKKIITKNKKVTGIKTEKGDFIISKFVVSNADATLTFKKLLDCRTKEAQAVDKLKVSLSAFVVYIGLNKELNIIPRHYTTWFFSTYDVEKCYGKQNILNSPRLDYILCSFPSLIDSTLAAPGKSIVRLFIGAEFARENTWDKYRDNLYKKCIQKVNNIIPDIEKFIEIKEIGTPHTFYRFTSNRNGALFGWSAIPRQVDREIFSYRSSIENLYLTGHWVTNGVGQSGVAVVAFSGKHTATAIIKKMESTRAKARGS